MRKKRGEKSWNKYIRRNRNSSIVQHQSLLSLVRGSLQHERDFQQSVVILELRQHLQQENNGSVHMRCKTSWAINLIYWNTPDALEKEEEGQLGVRLCNKQTGKIYSLNADGWHRCTFLCDLEFKFDRTLISKNGTLPNLSCTLGEKNGGTVQRKLVLYLSGHQRAKKSMCSLLNVYIFIATLCCDTQISKTYREDATWKQIHKQTESREISAS